MSHHASSGDSGRRAQSEVISSILMVGVITVAVTTFGVAVLATQDDRADDTPRANVDAIVTTDSVEFAHQGGRTLDTADLSARMEVNGSDVALALSSGTWSGPDDSRFEGGERWWVQRSLHRRATVKVWLIDEAENRVLVSETRNPARNGSGSGGPNPQVSLATPSGGETFTAGQTVTIDWTESDDETSIASRTVEYSTDGGSTWTAISEDDGVPTQEDWTVPSTATTQGVVRVTVTDGDADGPYSASDRNTPAFTIDTGTGAPSVAVDRPNGGETLSGGDSYTVEWTASDDETSVDTVAIDYSTDGGSSWSNLATGLSNDGSESVAVPYVTTTNALVRVSATDTEGNAASDESDAAFTIDSTAPSVAVGSPNGGETVRGGDTATIQWTASDSAAGLDGFDVEYSTDGGSSWTHVVGIADGTARSYDWTVPAVDSSNVLVRVIATDAAGNAGTDESDATFTVDSTAPAVSVADPNGGESLRAGSTYTIAWSDDDALSGVDSADVDYSTDGGSSWSDVATVSDGSESVDWSVPGVDTTEALVRVSATDAAGNTGADGSDGTFEIASTPTIAGVTLVDDSRNSDTKYELLYDVDDTTFFDHVDVTFDNRDNDWGDAVKSNTSTRGSVTFSQGGGEGSTYDVTVEAYDVDGSVVDTVTLTDVADGDSQSEGNLTESDSPEFAGTVIDDLGGDEANYEVSYNVTNRTKFGSVRVRYENLDSGGADATYTSSDPRTNVDDYAEADYGGTDGDTYQITVELLDDDGVVVDERVVTDVADGSSPAGNDDLSRATSPVLTSTSLKDKTKNNDGEYQAQFSVDDPAGEYQRTEVLFRNADNAWATKTKSSTSANGNVKYAEGGVEGDTYEVVFRVIDADGIVVDETTITDVADGTDP